MKIKLQDGTELIKETKPQPTYDYYRSIINVTWADVYHPYLENN